MLLHDEISELGMCSQPSQDRHSSSALNKAIYVFLLFLWNRTRGQGSEEEVEGELENKNHKVSSSPISNPHSHSAGTEKGDSGFMDYESVVMKCILLSAKEPKRDWFNKRK